MPGHDGKLPGQYAEFPAIDEKIDKCFEKDRTGGMLFLFTESGLARPTLNEERQWGDAPETFCTQPETRVDFFLFFLLVTL
jgi:hypothetical protein